MFLVSKLLDFVCQPLTWALFFLMAGLWRQYRHPRQGRWLCAAALAALLLSGWSLPARNLIHQLETQTPAIAPYAPLDAYAGVVVLGGALEHSDKWQPLGRMALTAAGERMAVPVGLMQRNPALQVIFTGGSGRLQGDELTEAQRAKIFFDYMGADARRIRYESRSQTTFDNAVMTAELPGVDKSRPWLLLTTAAHMPRSLAVFRKVGWNVTPYPVDFRSRDVLTYKFDDWFDFSLSETPTIWYYALHELVGYWAYRLMGRI
jgi:uncharacterized SAM-binding protein YcdF (DUF218 family)